MPRPGLDPYNVSREHQSLSYTGAIKEVVNPYLVFNKTVAYLFNDSTKLHEIWTEDRTYRVQKIDMTYKVPRPPVAMATSENCGSLSILWQTYLSKYIQ